MKAQDYTNRYLPDNHTEPPNRDKIKCYYCGAIVDKWIKHRGVLICLVCAEPDAQERVNKLRNEWKKRENPNERQDKFMNEGKGD